MILNKRKGLAIIIIVLLIVLIYLNWPVIKDITIIDEVQSRIIRSRADNVSDLLQEQNIVLEENDKIEPGFETTLTSGMTIIIKRAKSVDLVLYGKKNNIYVSGDNVKEALAQVGIVPDENDKVLPGLEEDYIDVIQIIHVERKEIVEQESIPFAIEKVNDDTLYKGEQRIRQKGINGEEKLFYEVILEDGKETVRKLLQKAIVKEPVKQILAVGTLQTVSRGGTPISFKEVLQMSATGYTHTGNRTYTDIWPTVGIVAVDPKVIPLGTRLYIDGYGYATALDIGSAIKGSRIDLFFDTKKEALRWGRRSVQVFILE